MSLEGQVNFKQYLLGQINAKQSLLGQIVAKQSVTGIIAMGKEIPGSIVDEETIIRIIEEYLAEHPIPEPEVKAAKIGEVTLLADAWVGEDNLYSQVVSIDGTTEYSQVDLTPDVEQLAVFYEKDVTFVTENEEGVVTVYSIGQKPTNDYTIQVTITEVDA